MDAQTLVSQLAAGRSIESIAREAGRPASTVAYWVNKHGLTSAHAERHRPRGGIEPGELQALLDEGVSIRAIAERLDVSYTTVRHWASAPRAHHTTRAAAGRDRAGSRGGRSDD